MGKVKVGMQQKGVRFGFALFASLVVAAAGLTAYINFSRALNIGWVYWAACSAVVVLAIIMMVAWRNAGTRATTDFEDTFHRKAPQDPRDWEIVQRNVAYHIKAAVEAAHAAELDVEHFMDAEVRPKETLDDPQTNQALSQRARLSAIAEELRDKMARKMNVAHRKGFDILKEIEYLRLT